MKLLTGSSPVRLAVAMVCAALVVALQPGASATEHATDQVQVPVLAQTAVQTPGKTRAILTIHGVRRLAHATVIYFSIGSPGAKANAFDALGAHYDAFGGGVTFAQLGNAAAIDNKNHTAYAALNSGGNSSCFCTMHGLDDLQPGKAYVGYTEVAAVPKSTKSVDVFLAQQVFPSVPVQDGPMMPLLPTDQLNSDSNHSSIVLGTGWPTPATTSNPALGDPAPLPSASVQRDKFTYDITTRTVQGALTQSGDAIDLNGDVLFDFAKYDLTAKGESAVTAAVKKLEAAHVTAVTVTGYTDNTGSTSVNQPLSRKRAGTVAAELKKQIPSLRITQSGKGDADPVASNETSEGRQANRRVEIVPTDGEKS